MTCAYEKIYLERAQITLGSMLDYAADSKDMSAEDFYSLFMTTGYAVRFAAGEPGIVAGMSGPELAWSVMESAGLRFRHKKLCFHEGRSGYYWTGWALAYYQWKSARTFESINAVVPIGEIFGLYSPFHEMDVEHLCDYMENRMALGQEETTLARLRKYAELSQRMLSEKSGVSVRTIQQYEQRQKDISKAGIGQVERLSRAIGCDAGELIS